MLESLKDHEVLEGAVVTFTAVATDGDLPTQRLVFSLDPGAPAGAWVDPDRGLHLAGAGGPGGVDQRPHAPGDRHGAGLPEHLPYLPGDRAAPTSSA